MEFDWSFINAVTLLTGLSSNDVRGYSVRALFELHEEAMELRKAEMQASMAKGLF